MGDPGNTTTSGKHKTSAQNTPNAPPSKRQKTSTISDPTIDDSSGSFPGILAAVRNLTKLVEHYPQFHSKLEGMLQDLYNRLEPKVSASIRKEENTDSCTIFKLSNDELKLVLGYVGDNQYGFVACVSERFHQVYHEMFEGETSTSIETSAAVSVSCAQLCLGMEKPNCNTNMRAIKLFQAAVNDGQLEVLEWGQSSGYELETMLEKDDIAEAACARHLEVVKYLRQLSISWEKDTCAQAAAKGHLELLKWARVNQCPWNEGTCAHAAMNGHLELLKWARTNQCPWNCLTE